MSSEVEAARLACARTSPLAVAAHDKAAWLALFTADGVVNDPVGSQPHQGADALSRFYDTFIAPNAVHFEVMQDIVSGDTVARDVTIHIRMATGLQVTVPAHLRYELDDTADGLRIRHLSAHWELLPMVLQTLRQGWIGLRTYARLSLHMLRCQGIGGVFGFMHGFGGVGRREKQCAEGLLRTLRDGDREALHHQLDPSTAETLPTVTGALQWDKLIAAGRYVTASVRDDSRSGIALFEFGRRGRFRQAQFYW